VFASGYKYGLKVQETGSGDEAIYSQNFVNAKGYKSREPSYVWAPGNAAISAIGATDAVTIRPTYSGTAHIISATVGTEPGRVYIPMTIPSQMLGQEVAVEELAVYYKTTNSNSYIQQTVLARMTSLTQTELLINDPTHRTNTAPISYTLTTTGNYTLTAEAGPVSIQLTLHFADPSHEIYLYGVRLRLGHVD